MNRHEHHGRHEHRHEADEESVRGWFTGRLPQEWFTGPVEVTVDREEITVVGPLAAPTVADGASPAERSAAVDGRVRGFREDTRDQRIHIAREAEHRFGRKVAWGVEVDGERSLFTHLAVPVMTRLRQPQRMVLDTLVAAGVAPERALPKFATKTFRSTFAAEKRGEPVVLLLGKERIGAAAPERFDEVKHT